MRQNIDFRVDRDMRLRGWLNLPDKTSGPVPVVVLVQEFTMVKEQHLPKLADRLAQDGLATLAYDNRCFGESDGVPRGEVDPLIQCRDIRAAIGFLETRPEIDPDGIGLWGHSIAGGEALWVAAVDRRVKAVAAAAPVISGLRNARRSMSETAMIMLRQQLNAERNAIQAGAEPQRMKVTTDEADPSEPHAYADERTYYYTHVAAPADRFENEVTVRSFDYMLEFDATASMAVISPTPLLMMVATVDKDTPTDEQTSAFSLAHEPKHFLKLPGDHYDANLADFDLASATASRFFRRYLGGAAGDLE